ncbi:Poly(3-hydroxyalkanoate) polymerase subunit PhaE [Candidatus Electrothrix gigas]
MKWKNWLENWEMSSLKIKAPFLETTWQPNDADKTAAWELYVELLTRISTQNLEREQGDEETALKSIYSLFDTTRELMKRHGRDCREFNRIAVIVLNQIIRPFTAKWHKRMSDDEFKKEEVCIEFRRELLNLQVKLKNYARMLSDMAGVEDLTGLEELR